MGSKVEIINNPYTQRVRILINGQAVSVYSDLEKYMDEPFRYWCDKILEELFEECNQSSFQLHFKSRQEEIKVMERLAADCPYCTQFSTGTLVRHTPFVERMRKLNALIKNNGIAGYKTSVIRTLFLLPESMHSLERELKELKVQNVYCRVDSRVMYYQEFLRSHPEADVVVFFSQDRPIEEYMLKYEIRAGFGIQVGKADIFRKKIQDVFLYETTEENIFQTVFECLLFGPLMDAFCACIRSMPPDVRQKYQQQFEDLQSTAVRIIPKPENTTIEVGRSTSLAFKTDIRGYTVGVNELHFGYSSPGIIKCNGLAVEGLKEGKSILQIFREGEQLPCASVEYTVIRRNRITDIRLEESEFCLGEGDSVRLDYTYLPADADNADSMKWESGDSEIASVDQNGTVRAKKSGSCMIRCYAEQVSAKCRCVVKPHLQRIDVPEAEINMIYGQERPVNFTLTPQGCIDDKIRINSLNLQVVNVVGRTMKAIGYGSTRVVIQNQEETVRTEIIVAVMSEKEYKNLQKKESGLEQKKKKKGFLAKLFGR